LLLVVAVVAANVDPLPAIVGPAGIIAVATKAEREEIAVVEPVVEMIMEVVMAPCSASAPCYRGSREEAFSYPPLCWLDTARQFSAPGKVILDKSPARSQCPTGELRCSIARRNWDVRFVPKADILRCSERRYAIVR
jgi:hypothetical protein